MSVHLVLDIGSSKVIALACTAAGSRARVLAYGAAPCTGAAHGGVTDVDAVASAIRHAVDRIERHSHIHADTVCASISQPKPSGHLSPRRAADREALVLAIEHAGLRVRELIPSALASAEATLDADERDGGVALADFGASTIDIALYRGGEAIETHVLESGGDDLTTSIATRFRLSVAEAEFLKRNVGCASPDLLESDGIVAVPSCLRGAGTAVTRREIAQLLAAQLAPLWRTLARTVDATKLARGLVITGGGSSLDGLPELAVRKLEHVVRRASPFGLIDLPGELQRPACATIAGLAQYVVTHAAHRDWRGPSWGRRQLASA